MLQRSSVSLELYPGQPGLTLSGRIIAGDVIRLSEMAGRYYLGIMFHAELMAEEITLQFYNIFKHIFDNAREGIGVFDLDSNLCLVNQSLELMTGCHSVQLIGENVSEIQFVDAQEREALIRALDAAAKGEVVQPLQVRFLTRAGKKVPVEVRFSRIGSGEEALGVAAICRDLSLRRKAQQAELQAERIKIAEVVADLPHEINNPLQIITGFTELLLAKQQWDEEVRRRLEAILYNCARIRDAVRKVSALMNEED